MRRDSLDAARDHQSGAREGRHLQGGRTAPGGGCRVLRGRQPVARPHTSRAGVQSNLRLCRSRAHAGRGGPGDTATFSAAQVSANLAIAAQARADLRASAIVPLDLGLAAQGSAATGPQTHLGAAALPLGLNATAQGARATFGQAAFGLAVGTGSQGTRQTFATAQGSLTLLLAAQGQTALRGSALLSLGLTLTAQGTRITGVGHQGQAALPLTLGITTLGTRATFGSVGKIKVGTFKVGRYKVGHGTTLVLNLSARGQVEMFARASLALTIKLRVRFDAAWPSGTDQLDLLYPVSRTTRCRCSRPEPAH